MTGCILRVATSNAIAPTDLRAENTGYGFMVEVAHEDADFKVQVQRAEQFLAQHGALLSALTKTPGFQSAELDFGVWNKAPEVVAQFHSFPASLVVLAGRCGVGLAVSLYLTPSPQQDIQLDGPASGGFTG